MAGYRGNLQKKQLLEIWKQPREEPFYSGFLILGYELPTKVIKKSLSSCALNLPMGGSKDDMIHCLKEGQPCSGGRSLLRSQLGWVNQTQILLSVPVLMLRKHIRHYIFWTRIMKRTVTLKLSELYSLLWTAVVWTYKSWILERDRKWLLRKPLKHVSVF